MSVQAQHGKALYRCNEATKDGLPVQRFYRTTFYPDAAVRRCYREVGKYGRVVAAIVSVTLS